jgi:hypothetical protein
VAKRYCSVPISITTLRAPPPPNNAHLLCCTPPPHHRHHHHHHHHRQVASEARAVAKHCGTPISITTLPGGTPNTPSTPQTTHAFC